VTLVIIAFLNPADRSRARARARQSRCRIARRPAGPAYFALLGGEGRAVPTSPTCVRAREEQSPRCVCGSQSRSRGVAVFVDESAEAVASLQIA
jgi:hypothetical protein